MATFLAPRKLFALSLMAGMTPGFCNAQEPARPRILHVVDDTQRVTLTGSLPPLPAATADLGAAPDSLQLGRTILLLKSSAEQQASLNKLVDDQQNSTSPSYHAWLKPDQFGATFGVASEDMEKITAWLTANGFQVEAPMAGRNLIVFSGSHAQLKAAFHTEIHSYTLNGQTYYANANNPEIPAAFADVISGFSSLNNFPRHAQHTAPILIQSKDLTWQLTPDAGRTQPQFTTTSHKSTVHVVAPYDLATIYNIKPLWDAGVDGTGTTIAIVADSNINPADVDYFRSIFGLPAKKLNIINYGPDPGMNGDESEADLDVEWSGAVAKNATIDLVVAANTATSGGIDGAAAFIINNNLAPILSVSFGECELRLGTAGNTFYNAIWEQAAAQGITVLVASGDSGSASCDQNQSYATSGFSVSGLASTPYNVAVGGTDFHSSYSDAAKYWNTTNDPITLASVKSYLPESTWNNTCANPQILAALQKNGLTDQTTTALCNDANEQTYLTTGAGSGGASNCAVTTPGGSSPCTSGTPKPAWQSGVTGIPKDGVRDLPDISLMSGSGVWSSFYPYCQSDVLGGTCSVTSSLQGAGGTSFATPIFAGIMALVQQKTGALQGNANYVLYKLAATQYAGAGAAACTSNAAATGNACVFYDITDSNIAVPCYFSTPNCPAMNTPIGILPGYDTTSGYDLATGLGTVNAYNLVQGWSGATATFLSTMTTIAASTTSTAVYGTSLAVAVSVAPVAPATGSPSGNVGITSNSPTPSSASVADLTLVRSSGTVQAPLLPVGTYNLYATYAGDATFAPSKSSGLSVTITQTTASTVLTSTRAIVASGHKVSFSVAATGVSGGVSPTGQINFTDSTNGTLLGNATLSTNITTGISIASLLVSSTQLQLGSNVITASYSGDASYAASTVPSITVSESGSFTNTINPGSLTIAPNGNATALVTVTPTNGTVLAAGAIALTCPSTLPAGIVCSFSPTTLGAGGVINSTLTLQLSSPLLKRAGDATQDNPTRRNVAGTGIALALASLFWGLLPKRRHRSLTMLTLIASCALFLNLGCAGGGKTTSNATLPLIATTTTLTVPVSPGLGSPAIFTANVAGTSGTGTPTGTVTFTAGSTTLGTSNLTAGSTTFTTSALQIGSQAVLASYAGDTIYAASASAKGTVAVSFTSTIVVTASDKVGDQSAANLTILVQ